MEGDGSGISTTLHFTAAGGLPAADSAFATANGCMQVGKSSMLQELQCGWLLVPSCQSIFAITSYVT